MDQAARVQRLKVPAHQGAIGPVRQQVSRWLQAQTPARLGLPTDAIVLLRSVRAPWSALHPDSPADVLGTPLRHAARPATGAALGAGCDAVWFADEAELLACLARDGVQGNVGHRWWWQTWMGHRPTAEDALRAWLKSARLAPAAMARLDTMGHGLAWSEHMGTHGRLALFQAMQAHHPVARSAETWLAQVLSGATITNDPGPWQQALAPDAASEQQPDGPDRHDQPSPAMTTSIGSVNGGAAVLLGLCTLLHEAPHLALDERKLVARLQAAVGPSGTGHAQAVAGGAMPKGGTELADEPHRHPTPPPRSSLPLAGNTGGPWQPGSTPGAHHRPRPRVASGTSSQAIAKTTAESTPGAAASGSCALPSGPVTPNQVTPAARSPAPLPMARQALTPTSHGGLFFLLNVALAWELYGDFTRPGQALLSVSPWQFLHAAGIALLGRPFTADPLAGWLLAQAPFSRPRPASALGDTPRHLLPEAEARRLPPTEAIAPTASRTRPTAKREDNELGCWWPLLRQRLSLALALPEREAVSTCLSLPARIERRGERVDVHFALQHLPLAVRLAGLDRNPGWLPASGCDIRFHFEA